MYEEQLSALLDKNQMISDSSMFKIDRYIPSDALAGPPDHAVFIDLKQRMAGAGVGAISAIVASKVIAKAMSKGALKVASQAIAKAAATKVASGGGGAAIGAIIGSIVPGVGTLIGGGIGAFIGLVFGVSVDALLLTVEEYYSRDEFREQIISWIRETQLEFHASIPEL